MDETTSLILINISLEFLITCILEAAITFKLSKVFLLLNSWIILIKVLIVIIIINVKFLNDPTHITAIAKTTLIILNNVNTFSFTISETVFVPTSVYILTKLSFPAIKAAKMKPLDILRYEWGYDGYFIASRKIMQNI